MRGRASDGDLAWLAANQARDAHKVEGVIIGVSQERDRAAVSPLRGPRLEAQPLPGEVVGDRRDIALPEDELRPGRAPAAGVLKEREPAIIVLQRHTGPVVVGLGKTEP